MKKHNAEAFLRSLSAKLAPRSRHVCVFLGAGSSRACGLPDIDQLKARVLEKLETPNKELFSAQLESRNVEEALSRVRRIAALLRDDQQIDGLTALAAEALDQAVCAKIVAELDVSLANLVPARNLAVWAGRSRYSRPIEVFTVNYDLLIESAFDRHKVAYFDGFLGNLRAQFQNDLVDSAWAAVSEAIPPFFVRLWKLHGSVNWAWEDSKKIVRIGAPVVEGQPAAIYPSDMKYEESRRVPFLVLQDRFRRALNEPETFVIVSGYSFGDDHLNELIFDAVERHERTEVVAFCYAEIPSVLSEKAATTPNLQVVGREEAVLGGVRLGWSFPEDQDSEFWGEDKLNLPDFSVLARFLAKSTGNLSEKDPTLKDLLVAAAAAADLGV